MMEKSNREILSEVENYYSGKIAAHGATPQGLTGMVKKVNSLDLNN